MYRKKTITKDLIRNALFVLLDENGNDVNNVKIVDLVKKAGVSRASFYRHYKSTNDVLMDAVDLPINEVVNALNANHTSNWKTVIEIFRKNEFYLKKINENGHLYLILERFNKQFSNDNYHMIAWGGLVYNIFATWINNGMKESNEEILKIIEETNLKIAKDIRKTSYI